MNKNTVKTHDRASQKKPQLRFPEFEGAWEEKRLGEILSFKNGVNAPKEKYGKGYKFINVLDIIENDFITHQRIKGAVDVSEDVFMKNIVEYGDILFQRSSETREEVGQSNVYLDKNEPAIFGGFVIRGKKIEDYFPVFMNYLLKTSHSRKEITTKSGGSTRYNVGQVTLSNVKIITTHIPEQTKIANFLTAVDKRINLLQKKKAGLTQYKKGVMQKLFDIKADGCPALRFKQDDGSDFPDWEEKKLGEVCKILSSKRVLQKDWKESGVPFYRTREIINLSKGENFKTPIFITEKLFGSIKNKYGVPKTGDILVTGVGSIGEAYIVKENDKFYFKDGNVLWFKIPGDINSNFIYQSFKIRFIKKQLSDNASITTVATFTIEGAKNTNILLPRKEEQQKIADFLSSIDKSIENIANQIEQSQTWKQGLLQKMFV